ncbi:MAG TPA: hypothetical protein VEU28_09310, partial [Actinomycetota bacterium]|nr:hypothetical protein [Actinomycetota bacterium]
MAEPPADSPAGLGTSVASPDLGLRAILVLALLGCALAIAMNPSLAAHLDRIPGDSADRMFQSWQV